MITDWLLSYGGSFITELVNNFVRNKVIDKSENSSECMKSNRNRCMALSRPAT